ncbi:DHS-like NAD/FAD-binding domain-containing protein [Geopyxis carbonaria]|nr:DHS-like NAD/FAD-binding domain-containing protein [Geopyxis carbonaria]
MIPRIPYTTPFPPPTPHPPSTTTLAGAISALSSFLTHHDTRTLLLTGAGISVASGLSDYRGAHGTYRLNRAYRPIFYAEFTARHAARQRYWARSFLGWPQMARARPNGVHAAVQALRPRLSGVVTQNVDSLHSVAAGVVGGEVEVGERGIVELHGTLRSLVCLTCRATTERARWQHELERLNPQWAAAAADAAAGTTELHANPDGDVALGAGTDYTSFRYPACEQCLSRGEHGVVVDDDGAQVFPTTTTAAGAVQAGVLKPCVTFFGESVDAVARARAEEWVQRAGAVLVVGSSLATYSAWRLVREVEAAGKGVAILNVGGVRGEEGFFAMTEGGRRGKGGMRVRIDRDAGEVLEGVVRELGLGEVRMEVGAEVEEGVASRNHGLGG